MDKEQKKRMNEKFAKAGSEALHIGSVSHRFSDDEIKSMALKMIYQMTGEKVPKEEQCRWQGNANYQIAMTYLNKVNGG